MKYITLILALALCSCSVLKQVPEPVNSDYTIFHSTRGEIVYHHEQVDVVSTFPGGEPAMFEWMEKNIQYPRDAVESKKEGTVYASFIVEKNGKVSDIVIIQGIFPSCDKEVKRLLGKFPKWTLAIKDDKKVIVDLAHLLTHKLRYSRLI
ncbi:hypothetical protein COB55_04040 [Candidatus Wolfebacteria bacterium]|nr:MAG: hypothetical protein COB55_04040 [Candidatus Wolfebacteria bacterium]